VCRAVVVLNGPPRAPRGGGWLIVQSAASRGRERLDEVGGIVRSRGRKAAAAAAAASRVVASRGRRGGGWNCAGRGANEFLWFWSEVELVGIRSW
jgi:hypothetical protein